ncbi:histidine phosphatase family protein [Granulosicoccus antarcticus]|uniref:Phosphoserine phosphatase 1 n=1 Tax=Granulosicoccus antarcticus IMCC3135 TaxID=1192854 RepID=A0A2Z2P3G9_9GAMM|nr:histidine phosphatase family protein [Granulosicoccus antarcticus]ASJ75147.1 Phosphoserine phosphatase 1 [Granulosicoccus antarcticus IMCC3135]
MALRTLDLIRHGHTVWHDNGGVAGRSDIALSERGGEAVVLLAEGLGPDWHVDAWYCSPLQRTRETLALLRQRQLSLKPEAASGFPDIMFDERLVELDFGDWEGLTWSQVHEQHEERMREWGEDWVNRSPPNGETFAQQAQRCGNWLQEVQASLAGDSMQSAVAVLHGGSIRALMCLCLGWPLSRAMDFRVDPATLCRLEYSTSGEWMVRTINSQTV